MSNSISWEILSDKHWSLIRRVIFQTRNSNSSFSTKVQHCFDNDELSTTTYFLISSLSSFWHQQDPLPWVYQQILLQWPKIIVPKTIMPGKKLKFDFTVQNDLITLLLLQIRFWFRVFFYVLLFLVENLLQPKRKSYWLLLGMIIVSNFGWLIQVSFYFEIIFIFYF